MSGALLALDAVLALGAGAAVAGLAGDALRPLERVLIAVVCGVVIGSGASYGLALIGGLSAGTVLGGPAAVDALALLIGRGRVRRVWSDAWTETRAAWAQRPPVGLIAFTVIVAALFAALFAHTVFDDGGALAAGYPNVWADWSQHLSVEASFAVAGNIPPQNPLFSGTPLLYPFLPDFQSATLVVLGMSPGAALAVPGAILAVTISLLVVSLGMRLGARAGAGMIAVAICFLGGGLGFIGVFADACAQSHTLTAAQCTFQHVVGNPGDGVRVIGTTLHNVPGIIAAQPRPYDGDLTSNPPMPNLQWYTPLFAWWLPQRTILYGFAAAASTLILVQAALRDGARSWPALAVAGVLVGLLPLVHVQTLIALVIILAVVAVRHRSRQWLVLAAAALPLAIPRLAQLIAAPHGSAAFGNTYPWLEPGWLAGAAANTPASAPVQLARALGQVVSPGWWGFWFVNLGVAVPLSAILLLLLAARLGPARVARAARRATAFLPPPLIEIFLAATLVFAACNFIVFQSWDWDNTKLFVYWYLVVAILVGVIATHAWGRRWMRALAALVPASMLITGVVVMLRLLPWTPPEFAVTGPYTIASADERAMAARVSAMTAPGSVVLTLGRPNDPVLAITGRNGVMGYYGWLWSYGIDFGTRPDDERAIYAGCSAGVACNVPGLLHRYSIDYVEVDDRVNDPGAITTHVNQTWWASQGYPVVATSAHIVVYDVRNA